MRLWLNGVQHDVDHEPTVGELIGALGLTGRRIAIDVNEEIIPRSKHASTLLSEDDRIEVVHAMGGG